MIIKAILSGPFETNAYVIGCPATKEAAIVDPAPESTSAVVAFLKKENLKPIKILLTHTHWDHIADIPILRNEYDLPIYVHERDAQNLRQPGSDGLPLFGAMESIEPEHLLKEGDQVSVGDLNFRVIHTPGHTPGGICFYEENKGILISGDTLFKGTIGNLSFPTASPDDMWDSLKKLNDLPPETKIYPGHGLETTIEEESWLPNAKQYFGG
ncbi:MAG: putative metallo-hydrolase [Chlamydiae bacterium]|nr:putative metallo-hydrolase [Chlamydiota bacterium]